MTLVQLSDMKEIQLEPHKSPWQVRHCHDWITEQLCFSWDWFTSATGKAVPPK